MRVIAPVMVLVLSLLSGYASAASSDRLFWINRVATALRNGHGISPSDPTDVYDNLTDEEVVRSFMKSPEFSQSAVQFMLYYGDFQEMGRSTRRGFLPELATLPEMVTGAKAINEGGNFFELFAMRQQNYLGNILDPSPQGNSSDQALSVYLLNSLNSRLDEVLGAVAADAPFFHRDAICGRYADNGTVPDGFGGIFRMFSYGNALSAIFSGDWLWQIHGYCFFGQPEFDIRARFADLKKRLATEFIPKLIKHSPRNKPMLTTKDYVRVDDLKIGLLATLSRWETYTTFWQKNTNSSTNRNRKRAAFILKNYFCDDLVPLDVVQGANKDIPLHFTANDHASDPKCQSCHYKLDPMAGFFREFGRVGLRYTSGNIEFDDGVQKNFAEYASYWKGTPVPGKEWNVGFVRSATDPKLNDYGTTLEDLAAIMQTAPEAKQCLTKKLWNFYVGENQAVDSAYLAKLSEKLNVPAEQSGAAIQSIVAEIMASRTVRQRNPDQSQCYDEVDAGPNQPPCAARYLLKTYCVSCHGDKVALGKLNLEHWVKDANGVFNFVHLNEQGVQKSKTETFASLYERMTTSKADTSMPKSKFIRPVDRANLVKWIEINKGSLQL